MISGCEIEFENNQEPLQTFYPKTIVFSKTEAQIIENEIKKLLAKTVIEPVQHSEREFVSPIKKKKKKEVFGVRGRFIARKSK